MVTTAERWAATVVLACACALVGCIQSPLVTCGDNFCPPGSVCTTGGCALPADVAACDGIADGAGCRAANGGAGTCQGGSCRTGLCGNGILDVGEACDDGNQISGDGCRADCAKIERCGDGLLDQGEACDDGNQNEADGCDMCMLTVWKPTVVVGAKTVATTTALASPSGVAIDGLGRVVIADTDNHRIRRVELDGSITTLAGIGTLGFSGDGGPATSAQLAFPNGVAVDGLGRVFIADTNNHRIRRVEVDGTITTAAGTGTPGFAGDNGAATLAQLSSPFGVAVDGLGQVIIADTANNRIRQIATDGTIATIAGTGASGSGGDGGQATAADLSSPYGVVVDGLGRVVIADTYNQVVRRIELDDTITRVAGTGSSGFAGDGGQATAAELSFPVSVGIDAQGRIVLADTGNQRIRRIASDGTIGTVAGSGAQGFGGDGGAATSAQLAIPFGIAVDGQGRIAIADSANQRIRRVAADSTITTIAGTGTFGFGGDGGEATSAQLANPFGVGVDGTGRIYVADTFNQRIRRIDIDGTITTVAGAGTTGFSGDGGAAASAQLDNPNYVAIDAMGRTVISDTFNQRIRRVELDNTITTIAGDGTQGSTGDGGPATAAELSNPNGVAVDGTGRVVIADTYNCKIRRIELDGTITTVAGTGAFGFGGDGGPAVAAVLSFPYGVGIDGTGRILIGDTGNSRVRRIELDGTIVTVAGTGVSGYSGDGGPATSAKIAAPYGVAADPAGGFVFADQSNQRIRRIGTTGTISTLAGTGTSGSSGDAGPATSAEVASPLGVAIDGAGRVIITDTNNQRIRRIEADGTLVTVAGKIDPENTGPVGRARLEDPQAIVIANALTLVAAGTSGTLEVVRNGRVEVIAGRYPQATPTGNLARFRTDTFGSVGGTAFDPATGLIYMTETSANRLHVITQVDPARPETWTIATLANSAGLAGFADGAAATARFRAPTGLFLDSGTRTLYIADTGNHAIRALDLASGTVSTVVNASHSLGFSGDGGAAVAALLYRPTAITRCANGDLFIADTGNNRVRRVVADSTITTVLGDGVPASSGEGSPARTFPVDSPAGLACDVFGDLFVTSSTTVRLLPASDVHVVDGGGAVQTIYGAPPRTDFPASDTSCLTGLAVTNTTTIEIADACTGLVIDLSRAPAL